jgi:hypothetical protein
MNDDAHPGKILSVLVTSCAVIGLGYLAWSAILVFTSEENLIGMLPLMAAPAYAIYRSVFGRSKTATNIVTTIYLFPAALLFISVVTSIGEAWVEGDESISSLISFVLTFLSISLVLALFGVVSFLWGRHLKYDIPLVPTRPWLGKLLIVVTLSLCFVGCSHMVLHAFTDVDTAEHVASVSWLPEEASDICYYRSYGFTAYEFDISEQGFLDWAESRWAGWDVQPIEEPVSVTRYRSRTDSDPPYDWDAANDLMDEDPEEWERQYYARRAIYNASISHGFYYGHETGNGGGVQVAYDSEKGRAYVHSTPR